MPLLSGGNFGTDEGTGVGDDFGADCDRLRESFEEDALRLSTLFVER
jgi:hypothetical protein